MNNELLQLKGLISMLSEDDQLSVKLCIANMRAVMSRYPEGIYLLALAHIGLEKQGGL